MNTTKKLSLILLIIAIAVALWYAINLSKNQGNNKPAEVANNATSSEPIVAATSTKDWLTYRNEEYGFEVKYPGEWKEKDTINDNYQLCLVDIANDYLVEESEMCLTAVSVKLNNNKNLIEIVNLKPVSLRENTKNIIVDGEKSKQIINYLALETITIFKNRIYYIVSPNFGSDEINSQIHGIYNKIIETFRFID